LYAVQKGLEIVKSDKSGQDTKPFKTFLMNEMQTLRVIPTTRQFSNQSFTQNNINMPSNL
jgi:hypothetical protein